ALEQGDLGLIELVLPPRVETGAPLVARARLAWRPGALEPGGARLDCELESGGTKRSFEQPLALPAQGGEFELALPCGPAPAGRSTLAVRCAVANGPDAFPENDRASTATSSSGTRLVGVVAADEGLAGARAWLAPEGRSRLPGLEFAFFTPQELAAQIGACAALVSFDLAPSALATEPLESFVLQGGGWLAVGGWRFLDDWGAAQRAEPRHALLPCEPAAEPSRARDVVLLVDGSGSMDGAPFETVRAAALDLVGAALPGDRVSLRFFTGALETEHVLRERVADGASDVEGPRRAARERRAPR